MREREREATRRRGVSDRIRIRGQSKVPRVGGGRKLGGEIEWLEGGRVRGRGEKGGA